MFRVTCLAALLIAAPAFGADRLMLDIYTQHSKSCRVSSGPCDPWDQPRRLSWQHDLTDALSFDLGAGTNSYGRGSANAALAYQPIHAGPFRAGLWAGYASGYKCDELRTCKLVGGAVATIKANATVLQVLYVPAVGRNTTAVTQLRAGVEF